MLKNQLITPEGTKDYLFEEAAARRRTAETLRALFEGHGYCEVITPGLEFPDVFSAKGHALPEEEMYRLTDYKGRLMTLRPDSTMPIARLCATRLKNSPLPLRLFYNQAIYLANRSRNGSSDEVMQAGVELVGSSGEKADLELLGMAAEVMAACGQDYRLELGHIGIFNALVGALNVGDDAREELRRAIEGKNIPALDELLAPAGDCPEAAAIRRLPRLFGGGEVFALGEQILPEGGALRALRDLQRMWETLREAGNAVTVDLGLVNRADYYTGVVFKGYLEGIGGEMLSGGRYDGLLSCFGVEAEGERAGAIGFAVDVDAAARVQLRKTAAKADSRPGRPIRIALTKGRLEEKAVALFEAMGFDCSELHNKGRRLVLRVQDGNLEVVLAKAADVITYIENGVCDLGIVGRDTILEYGGSFFEVADLGFGKCRFALAGKAGSDFYSGYNEKTIATKYPNVARGFFRKKGMDVRIVKIEGSVELAPLLGLADGIVDIVETGSTLRENGLTVIEEVAPVSARLIVNRVSLKLYQSEIEGLIEKMETALNGKE